MLICMNTCGGSWAAVSMWSSLHYIHNECARSAFMAWKGSVEVSEMNEELSYSIFLYSVSGSKPQLKPLED